MYTCICSNKSIYYRNGGGALEYQLPLRKRGFHKSIPGRIHLFTRRTGPGIGLLKAPHAYMPTNSLGLLDDSLHFMPGCFSIQIERFSQLAGLLAKLLSTVCVTSPPTTTPAPTLPPVSGENLVLILSLFKRNLSHRYTHVCLSDSNV